MDTLENIEHNNNTIQPQRKIIIEIQIHSGGGTLHGHLLEQCSLTGGRESSLAM